MDDLKDIKDLKNPSFVSSIITTSLEFTTMTSNPNPKFDENKWVMYIRSTLEKGHEFEIYQTPVSISNVPKILLSTNPDSYTPQEVAIGPYNHWRPEVYEMERYKLAATKRNQKELLKQGIQLEELVVELKELADRVRACYHKFLYLSNETLAWMMAIDGSFLLEFLLIYAVKEGKVTRDSTMDIMSHLVDYAGTKSAHNSILRDMVMLENQIPLFVLRKILELLYSSVELADDMLQTMLIGFCEELSPFRITKKAQNICVSESYHLLDYLYLVVVPEHKHIQNPSLEINVEDVSSQNGAAAGQKKSFIFDLVKFKKLSSQIWKRISNFDREPIKSIKKGLKSRCVQVFFKLPWKMLSKIPGISVIALPIQFIFFSKESELTDSDDDSSTLDGNNRPPLFEEIKIPSVTELIKAQVRVIPTKSGNISRIRFDAKTATLHLPPISLDINTEVVLRNLVAYEASNVSSGPLIFTRYTELMNGIIDTAEDVKLLRERGIILNRMNSDAEVAHLWNGMTKSIRLTKVPSLDKVVEDVNKYYNSRWKVKFRNYMRLYLLESWKLLTVLATTLLLWLMMLQAVCSVYNCPRLFHIDQSSN